MNLAAIVLGGFELLFLMIPCFLIGILGTVFWIWMLIDCATKESGQGNDRVVWVVVIALTHLLGALIYFFARRPTRIRELGA
jgi:hypothetical protein